MHPRKLGERSSVRGLVISYVLVITQNRRIYRPTHLHHPCVLWAGETEGNRSWLLSHGFELCAEYRRRFGREHASLAVITTLADHPLTDTRMTPFAQAMPDVYRGPDVVEAYRRYYLTKLKDARGGRLDGPTPHRPSG